MGILKEVSLVVGITAIIIMTIALILSQMNTQMWDYYSDECDSMNGRLITYECYNSLSGYCDLDTTQTGVWCSLPNGTEVDLTIKNASQSACETKHI